MRQEPRSPSSYAPPKFEYIVFNKPYGVMTSFTDALNRATLADYISIPGVYAAGRLDRDSEGLLLLTSDGKLVNLLTDPKHKMPKTYLVQVERIPDGESVNSLREGVLIQGKRTKPANVELLEHGPDLWERGIPIRFRKSVPTAWLHVTISEGMNRQIRRMTAAVGHPTLRLVRMAIGPIQVGSLQPGEWRRLEHAELQSVFDWIRGGFP